MIVSLLLSIVGLGIIARLVIHLSIHALPVAAGLWSGLAAHQAGAGPIGGIAVGFVAGAIVFALGAVIAEHTRSPILRGVVSAMYAAPAAVAGYYIAYRLGGIGALAEWWRSLISVGGAIVLGAAAWRSINTPRPGGPEWSRNAPDRRPATSQPDAARTL